MVDFAKHLKKAPRLDLNPSAADRWTTCTASPQFLLDNADKLPASDDTKYNQEGTTAHEVASAFLQDREPRVKDAYHCPVPVTPEIRWHGWQYAEYVQGLIEPGGKLLVEQKLPLWYMPGRNAIVDAAIINQDSLHIVDYKYGAGVVVSPENSLQAAIYARCVVLADPVFAVFLGDDYPITIHIYQPRGRAAYEGAPHVWETTWGEVFQLTKRCTEAADNIIQKYVDRPLVFFPSEKACQWCPAKGFCVERQRIITQDIEALAVIDNGDKHLPPVKAVSVKQLSAILKHKAQIIKWLNDAEAYALEHMRAGNRIPGFKLVTSRGGNRYWSDPKRAAKLLLTTMLRRDEVIEEKVISPAGAETLLGKHGLSVELTNLIAKAPGGPTIAPDGDKRESCFIDAATEFTALPEESLSSY